MTLEQSLLEKVRSLPPAILQEVLDFAEFLVQKTQIFTEPQSVHEVDERGWPVGYFERIYGICADAPIMIDDEGISEALDDDTANRGDCTGQQPDAHHAQYV